MVASVDPSYGGCVSPEDRMEFGRGECPWKVFEGASIFCTLQLDLMGFTPFLGTFAEFPVGGAN